MLSSSGCPPEQVAQRKNGVPVVGTNMIEDDDKKNTLKYSD